MYTLRKIQSDGLELNIAIGTSYRHVSKKNRDLFEQHKKDHGFAEASPLEAIIYDGNDVMHPVWTDERSFIMTEGGKTFERL